MNKKRPSPMGSRRQGHGGGARPSGAHARSAKPGTPRARHDNGAPTFRIVERQVQWPGDAEAPESGGPGAFRILIAVHRPRYRVRAERAANLIGWAVTSLLNKQDPVGLCAKPPRPPDLLVISGDFGRQRDFAILRAVQPWRRAGMKLIGLVDECTDESEGAAGASPESLCDVCLTPPYKTADLRALFSRLYEEIRGESAPPPVTRAVAEPAEDADEN